MCLADWTDKKFIKIISLHPEGRTKLPENQSKSCRKKNHKCQPHGDRRGNVRG